MMTRLCILLFRWFAQVLRGRQFRSHILRSLILVQLAESVHAYFIC